ncbi:hypothetical protein NUSPORA_01467 [Nucleospora cyclopteri]
MNYSNHDLLDQMPKTAPLEGRVDKGLFKTNYKRLDLSTLKMNFKNVTIFYIKNSKSQKLIKKKFDLYEANDILINSTKHIVNVLYGVSLLKKNKLIYTLKEIEECFVEKAKVSRIEVEKLMKSKKTITNKLLHQYLVDINKVKINLTEIAKEVSEDIEEIIEERGVFKFKIVLSPFNSKKKMYSCPIYAASLNFDDFIPGNSTAAKKYQQQFCDSSILGEKRNKRETETENRVKIFILLIIMGILLFLLRNKEEE